MNSIKIRSLVVLTLVLNLGLSWAAPDIIQFQSDEDDGDGDDDDGPSKPDDHDYRWPNATLIYKIDNNYTSEQLVTIEIALDAIRNNTCVKIRKYVPGDVDWVYVHHVDRHCSSWVGRAGGEQPLKLSDGCFKKANKKTHKSTWASITHEFIHALGFPHAQNRPDRDNYVTINFDNIKEDKQRQYKIAEAKHGNTYGLPYDFGSIMHYNAKEFVTDKSKDTMTPKEDLPEGVYMGQREHLSEGDIKMIKSMYSCPGFESSTTATTTTTEATTGGETTTEKARTTTSKTARPTTRRIITTTKPTTTTKTTTKPTTKSTTAKTTTKGTTAKTTTTKPRTKSTTVKTSTTTKPTAKPTNKGTTAKTSTTTTSTTTKPTTKKTTTSRP